MQIWLRDVAGSVVAYSHLNISHRMGYPGTMQWTKMGCVNRNFEALLRT